MIKAEFSPSFLQYSVSHDPSEIILICWFAAQETFLIILNFEYCYAASYFCEKWYNSVLCKIKTYTFIFFFNNVALNQRLWSDVWPSMVTHTQNLCSAFNPSKCTHSSEHTHTVNTHPEQWAVNAAAPGEQLVPCSRRREHWLFTLPHLQFLPDLRLEPASFGLQVWLSLSVRPRLPHQRIQKGTFIKLFYVTVKIFTLITTYF